LAEIKGWREDGEQLVIMGDFNKDTSQGNFKRWFQDLGLVDALAHLHGQPTLPAHNRGSNPIDAIYISPELLQGATGGYLSFKDRLLSDHRGMWIDLQMEVMFGSQDQVGVTSQARRLKCEDPRVVTRYNQKLLVELRKEEVVKGILTSTTYQHTAASGDMEKWDRALTWAKLEAEHQCRKLKTSKVDWCLLITQAINAIQYWKGWAKRQAGGVISNNVLQTWAWKAHLKHEAHGEGPTPEQIKQWLDMAYTTFKRLKGQQDRRDTWLGELIVAQVEAKGCCRSQLWKKVREIEKIRKVTRMVKRTLQPHDKHHGLMQVTEPYNGWWPRVMHTTKAQVEQACLEEAG